MKLPTIPGRRTLLLWLPVALLLVAGCLLPLFSGCAQQENGLTVSTDETPTSTAAPYARRSIDFYQGIAEPVDWHELLRDSDRLLEDGFNTVTLSPPVYITPRAGGRPRVILEGEAASAEALVDDFHDRGLAVHLSPTTKAAGYSEKVEPDESALLKLQEDAVEWARKAEASQAELFSPLSDYNLVLGTEAANRWSAQVLPLLRKEYTGPIGAKVVPDIDGVPAAGEPHDFESLDFKGYDYIMIDIFPQGEIFDLAQFDIYMIDILDRANLVAARDGIKGVIVSEFGSRREATGVDTTDGPLIDEDTQALMALNFLVMAEPRTRGIFFHGWTLPGRGARDHYVEDVLRDQFTK